MGKKSSEWDDPESGDIPEGLTPVIELPYYTTLRTVLEPYTAANDEASADKTFTSAEIIQTIEEHHGVPQGLQQGLAENWVQPEDFVRAMQYLGFNAVNTGGMKLEWLMKSKS